MEIIYLTTKERLDRLIDAPEKEQIKHVILSKDEYNKLSGESHVTNHDNYMMYHGIKIIMRY